MTNSITHLPAPPASSSDPKSISHGTLSLFTVKPDTNVEDALALASEYLSCAAAIAYETADNSTLEFRPLARSVVHQIEAARALIEASVTGLEANQRPS